MTQKRYKVSTLVFEAVMLVIAAVYAYPLFLTVINSFKTLPEVMISTAALPEKFSLDNFMTVWRQLDYPALFLNTLLITVGGVTGIVLFSSMAAYCILRQKTKLTKFVLLAITAAIVIPFQTMMIPLVQVARQLKLMNSLWGIMLVYWGLGLPFPLFLYHGFMKSMPRDLEEAARIDGCGFIRTFFKIVFPLMQPITTTIVILNVFWIFNDFLMPYIMLGGGEYKTIAIGYYSYFSQYGTKWNLSLAALTIGIVPVFLFYLAAQKKMIKGIMSGAVKS